MKLAWFRTGTPRPADPFDDTATLIAELRATCDIEVFTAANAHDFVWKDFRAPYDLSVCELDDTPDHTFIWPYLLHYGGVLLLRTLRLRDSRAAAFLRVPLLAARVTVVSHPSIASAIQQAHPDARVLSAAAGVREIQKVQRDQGVQEVQRGHKASKTPVTFGAFPADRLEIIRRAMARARQAGATAEVVADSSPARILQQADVVVSLPWPWFGQPQTVALAAMAAGTPAIVIETPATADWPALDPQTWRPRGLSAEAPIVVSIDPRDEEHSLALAIRRLSADATLRAALGGRAHEWWRAHATPRHAAGDWERILAEAVTLQATGHLAGRPGPFAADVAAGARAILDEFGVTVDFLSP